MVEIIINSMIVGYPGCAVTNYPSTVHLVFAFMPKVCSNSYLESTVSFQSKAVAGRQVSFLDKGD